MWFLCFLEHVQKGNLSTHLECLALKERRWKNDDCLALLTCDFWVTRRGHLTTPLHHAKSYRPFELFVNENCKLQNEAEMNVSFERGLARDASAQSSLHWDEQCFWVKNRRASCAECCLLGNDFVATTACVVPSRTKRLPGVIGRANHAAVVSHMRLVLDAILRDLLHCLWRVGLASTSQMHWEACLLWMNHNPMSPAWWHSMCGQIVGKLVHGTAVKS